MASHPRQLLAQFDKAMLNIYEAARKLKPPYTPTEFRRMVAELGGKETADRLLAARTPSSGFAELFLRGKENLKLSVEYLVLTEPWRQLFEEEQLEIARNRLRQVGCELPKDDVSSTGTSSTSWLHYWKSTQIREALADGLLWHVASNQYGKVAPGDKIWIVNVDQEGRLLTIGYISATEPISREEAARRVEYEPWAADRHIIVPMEAAQHARVVDLSGVAEQLRFDSETNDRLVLSEGKVNPQQLQTIRRLTADSAIRLDGLWTATTAEQDEEYQRVARELLDINELDQRREVLVRTEQGLLRRHLFGADGEGVCAICRRNLPIQLLVAAHVKRRSECTDQERRDYQNNVIPMCLLGCDALFERGLIVVKGGRINRGRRTRETESFRDWLDEVVGQRCSSWNSKSAVYFDWHASRAEADA